MNNVLAVTADLKRCSIAVRYENKLFEINENLDSPTYLVQLSKNLFDENDIDLDNIQKLITASGPGSFTGIRTAQSFVKGLSLALNIPSACCSYFDVIKNLYGKNQLIAIIKSEKNQVYYKDFSAKLFGIAPYQKFEENISENLPIVGDRIEEILKFTKHEFIEISDFKKARYLLDIENLELYVKPLYISAALKNN